MDVSPGTIVLYGDIACPWATLALHRFYAERERQGLDERVRVDLRLFSLEEVNEEPMPKRTIDAEMAVVGAAAPDFGFALWPGDPAGWPVTSLPANEAVHAAKRQSLEAAEQLDRALRRALFAEGRCISLRHQILAVAACCDRVDLRRLTGDLDSGAARSSMMAGFLDRDPEVKGSPHFFLADGTDVHNPGIRIHWQGDPGNGFPVIDRDDPGVYADLVRRAAA